jgi:adenylate cyclase
METVVGAIEPSLKRAEIARATAKPAERLDACDLCLRAWPCYNASGCEASDRAIALLRRALEKDPTYMRAKVFLASAYAMREAQDFVSRGDREMGIALAREILEMDTNDPEALCRAGFTISQLSGDFLPPSRHSIGHCFCTPVLFWH